MRLLRLSALVGCVLLAALAARVEPASACSCAPLDARSGLARADGAFVGTFVEQRGAGSGQAVYVFRVQVSLKGGLSGTVEIRAADNGAACGLEVEPGQRIGLLLERSGGSWRSNLCWQIAPADLLAAARPLPRPNGSGPLAFLVGGQFGDVRTIGLDRRGRPLRYGRGLGSTLALSVCPGSRSAAEAAWNEGSARLAVRNLRTFRVVRERPIAGRVDSIGCLDRNGLDVAAFVEGRLLRWRPSGVGEVWRGKEGLASFRAGVAWLSVPRRLVRVDLATGRSRTVATLPASTGVLEPSPGGRFLAGAAPNRLVLVRLRDGRASVTSRRTGTRAEQADVAWWGASRVVVMPRYEGAVQLYDTSLRPRGAVHGWLAGSSTVARGRVFGLLGNRIVSAQLPAGRVTSFCGLPGRVTHVLAAAN
jgi:hypothetical protein